MQADKGQGGGATSGHMQGAGLRAFAQRIAAAGADTAVQAGSIACRWAGWVACSSSAGRAPATCGASAAEQC